MVSINKHVVITIASYFMINLCSASLKKTGGGLGNVGCTSDSDCAENAYCINILFTYCMCKNDFVEDPSTSTCLPRLKTINDSCSIDLQCTVEFGVHSYCNKNMRKCTCMENAHFEDEICYESVRLGGRCKVSDNCVSTSGVATYCAQSVCICAANHHASADGTDCIQDVALGEKCIKDEDCEADFSYCNGKCSCQPSHVASLDGTSCLLAAKKLREQCLENLQCKKFLPNSYCDPKEQVCKCEAFTHELDNSCWKSVKLGEECAHPNQCITPSYNRSEVACNSGLCGCVTGLYRNGTGCSKNKDAVASSSTSNYSLLLLIIPVLINSIFCNL